MSLRLAAVGSIALWCSTAYALVDRATSEVCAEISNAIPGRLAMPNSRAYRVENADYWSDALSELRPACIALPTSAEDVSAVVKILAGRPEVKYAIKSGGHSPNPGFAAIDKGVLLSLANIRGAKYDAEKDVAYVGPGGHWKQVIADLAPYKKTVVGGRLDIVGVGGYLTGGGLSFLSAQYGMAADTISNFETVMANGSIVNVNAQTNPDLLVAMRGGGNQFGIVTKFTMKAVPIGTNGQVWGGPIIFSDSNRDAILAAFHDFTENPVDPKAAIILTMIRPGGFGIWLLHRFYDGAVPPPGVFKGFEKLSPMIGLDFGETRTYGDLLAIDSGGPFPQPPGRKSFRMQTLPLLPGQSGVESIKNVVSIWIDEITKLQSTMSLSLGNLALQSFPSFIGNATARGEGNALGLGAQDKPRYMLEFANIHSWANGDAALEDTGRTAVLRINQEVNTRVASMQEAGKFVAEKIEPYNPLFLNDASFDQDVYSTYKDFEKFRALQKQVDPNGLWRRTGGFKFRDQPCQGCLHRTDYKS